MTASSLISKIWSFCNTLRDDGVSYGDYLEQLTYLLFLKMADEYSKPPYNRDTHIPPKYNWQSLVRENGADLEKHYINVLKKLSSQKGMIGQIFFKSQNKIQDPAKLYKLVQMINDEDWVMLGTDIKGDIYEGLLEKNAEDTKSGAGQYFTPRPLIKAIVECIRPEPKKTIADPSCGTGGFFLAAYDYLSQLKLNKDQKEFLKYHTFTGWEIVPNTMRLCLMNLFLHNIGDLNSEPPIHRSDSLMSSSPEKFDYVLANPPFGKKSSITITNEEGEAERETLTYNRQDFWATTSNKQLNFVQHIKTMLKVNGSAAVIVPDNVLFEGGAGETVRKKLLQNTNLHTILRLPTGVFYAQGVKANVIFFDNKTTSKSHWTKEVWFYDLRTNKHFTLKTNPLKYSDVKDFIKCYSPANIHKRKETERFKKYTYDEIIARDKTSLDIFWLKDDSLSDLDNLPDPDVLALEIIKNLEAGLNSFRKIAERIKTKTEKPKINSTDLHAYVLGKVLCMHNEDRKYLSTLGHVKGEKISHTIENILDMDFGRNPVRDAAGPVDYNHLKKVEHRAAMKKWFFAKNRTGHLGKEYKKGNNLQYLINDFEAKLGDKVKIIEDIIRLFLKMDTLRAEVVTTVYSAWNDLLLDGKTPTNDEIVTESRENWHAEKLKIDKDKFYKSIDWLNKHDLIPKGMGKRTESKITK